MAKFGGKKAWIAAGVALLVGLAIVPAFSGAASLTPASTATASPTNPCGTTEHGLLASPAAASPDTQWSYGGQGWWNQTFKFDHTTITYNSSFGWTVVFTVTHNTATGVWTLEEQRTMGITIHANVTTPKVTVLYCYHAQESDAAFANITNHSTVYVKDKAVPALGLLNASVVVNGLIYQTLSITNQTATRTASLSVTGNAQASVSFSPALGLIPLNLTGVCEWNSSATATSAASWNIAWAYTELNGTSGSGSKTGSLSGTTPVSLTGFKFGMRHPFSDHKSRIGVILVIQGPFNSYDGFILVPHDFDLFGPMTHGYDQFGFGSAGISTEQLYVSPGPGGLAITAADQTFISADTMSGFGAPVGGGFAPAAFSSPSATVYGQPMTVEQAQAVDQGLTGTSGSSGHAPVSHPAAVSIDIAVVLVGVAVAAVVGTVGALGWVADSRRRSKGGSGGIRTSGVPPAAEDPNRPL
jgi:hypothetical protein